MCEDDELSHFMMKSIDSGTQEVLSEAPFLHIPQHSSLSQHPGEWGGRLWLLYFISISGDSKYPSGWVKSIFNINTPFVPSWPLWHSSLSVLFPNWRRRDDSEKKSFSREVGSGGVKPGCECFWSCDLLSTLTFVECSVMAEHGTCMTRPGAAEERSTSRSP